MFKKIKSKSNILLGLFQGILFPLLLTACPTQQFFSKVDPSLGTFVAGAPDYGSPETCKNELQQIENLKIIFMVDHSDSTDTTDKGTIRHDAIYRFIEKYGSNTHLAYYFSIFAKVVKAYDPVKDEFVEAVGNSMGRDGMHAGLNKFLHTSTDANTGYKAALGAIGNMIQNDVSTKPGQRYSVIFLSDGRPTDLGEDKAAIESKLRSEMNEMFAVATGKGVKVALSTVYFGPKDKTGAIKLLTLMAELGKGKFFNTNTSGQIEVDTVISIPDQNCGK